MSQRMNDADMRFIDMCLEQGDSVELISAFTGFSRAQINIARAKLHPIRKPPRPPKRKVVDAEVVAAWLAPEKPSVRDLTERLGFSHESIYAALRRSGPPERPLGKHGDSPRNPRRMCFICGYPAALTDRQTGEPLCRQHYYGPTSRDTKTVGAEWRMVADIRAWHAGSAYPKDLAMAKRLEGVEQ